LDDCGSETRLQIAASSRSVSLELVDGCGDDGSLGDEGARGEAGIDSVVGDVDDLAWPFARAGTGARTSDDALDIFDAALPGLGISPLAPLGELSSRWR
jgi:hypothetical protein